MTTGSILAQIGHTVLVEVSSFGRPLCRGRLGFSASPTPPDALPLCYVSHIGSGELPPTSRFWDKVRVNYAGASVGAANGWMQQDAARGEQKDNCPTLSYQKHLSPPLVDKQCTFSS